MTPGVGNNVAPAMSAATMSTGQSGPDADCELSDCFTQGRRVNAATGRCIGATNSFVPALMQGANLVGKSELTRQSPQQLGGADLARQGPNDSCLTTRDLMKNSGKSAVTHHFTVDLEEHFHVSALEPWVQRTEWESLESRVVESTTVLTDLLAEHGARGTFFVLGWVAERQPALIKALADAGHEIASHGWDHKRVGLQSREDFRASVRRTKRHLEDLVGVAVQGFRAPSFSIVQGGEWALDILLEEGYCYDSSLFPVVRRGYGYASGKRDPHRIERPAGTLIEVPPTTLRRLGVNIPAAGGAYLRLLPSGLVRSALIDSERRGVPGTFYIHPWELDPGQPRMTPSLLTRIRHYGGLARTAARLRSLLREFRFGPIADTVSALQLA